MSTRSHCFSHLGIQHVQHESLVTKDMSDDQNTLMVACDCKTDLNGGKKCKSATEQSHLILMFVTLWSVSVCEAAVVT